MYTYLSFIRGFKLEHCLELCLELCFVGTAPQGVELGLLVLRIHVSLSVAINTRS